MRMLLGSLCFFATFTATAADREAAEWTIRQGGRVILEGAAASLVDHPLARKHYLGEDFKL